MRVRGLGRPLQVVEVVASQPGGQHHPNARQPLKCFVVQLAGPARASLVGGFEAEPQARRRHRTGCGHGGGGARGDRHQELLVLAFEPPVARPVDGGEDAELLAAKDDRHEDRRLGVGRELLEAARVVLRVDPER